MHAVTPGAWIDGPHTHKLVRVNGSEIMRGSLRACLNMQANQMVTRAKLGAMQVDNVRHEAQDAERTDDQGLATDYFLVTYRELLTLRRDEPPHFIHPGQPYRFRGVRLGAVDGYGIYGVNA